MLKKILMFLIVAGIVGGGAGYYLFNKKVESMAGEKSELTVTAEQLFTAFDTDEAAATTQYVGKVITVSGQVRESSKMDDGTPKVILETGSAFGVLCEFDPNTKHARTEFQAGETLQIKGECAGLNLDVQIARCVVAR